jgi:hypothetical protein
MLNNIILTHPYNNYSCNYADYDDSRVILFLSAKTIDQFSLIHALGTLVISLTGHAVFNPTTVYAEAVEECS